MRMIMQAAALGLAILAAACTTQTAAAPMPATATAPISEKAKFEMDRKAILAMTGNFKVGFDFRETVALAPGYELKKPKTSGGEEIIRLVEDKGSFISLQHMLVVGEGKDTTVIKHWRQDWTYEPKEVLVFAGYNVWKRRALPSGSTRGEWSQEVYQVEDSPRYGAVGRWEHVNGVSQWTSSEEIRPLPRRDQTTRKDYDAVLATNRHVITPWGWVQEEDNTKVAMRGGKEQALAREVGVNTYRRSDDFAVKVGDDYWHATKPFWALVRADWAKLRATAPMYGLTVQGEPEPLYDPILEIADDVQAGKLTAAAGAEKARAVIAKLTTTDQAVLAKQVKGVIAVAAAGRN